MKASYSIREAISTDTFQIASLMKQLKIPQEEDAIAIALPKYIANKNSRLFVAEENYHIIGLISLYIFSLYLIPTKTCYIEALVVDENHRNKGIGKNLLYTGEKFALDNHCELIKLLSANWRKPEGVHDFYINEGYINQGEKGISFFYKSFKELWLKN
jgi:GNAT superfamily N-acetyltransferase